MLDMLSTPEISRAPFMASKNASAWFGTFSSSEMSSYLLIVREVLRLGYSTFEITDLNHYGDIRSSTTVSGSSPLTKADLNFFE
eukprot:IDg16139t1